jgi:hypothetical protein
MPRRAVVYPDDLYYRTDLNALKKWFLYYLSIDDLRN